MDSILTSVKFMLGITEDYEYFDSIIIIHINSVFNILTQLGAGPETGFQIEDKYALWSDFTSDEVLLNTVKTYMYLKVRLLFDPPTSSVMLDSTRNLVSELEWRINITAEQDI